MRQIVALASIVTLVAIVLSGCSWVPVDRGRPGYHGGPIGVSAGVTQDGWGDLGRLGRRVHRR